MTSTTSRSETDDERWFFGKISRADALDHLMKAGGQDGTFLVRESTSSPDNFVLSLVNGRSQADVLITQHFDDAFYSLITNPDQVFHGLDTLVYHYSQNPIAGAEGMLLGQPCIGEPPPLESRLHGCSNLLHRAVNSCNKTVVSELLKSGYRKIDAKNSQGQTALHIACRKGYEDSVRLLLDASAAVDVRDQDGLTPLQLACRFNHSSIVKLLVEKGHANIQLRTPLTGEVALHEAASCGSMESIKILFSYHAPAWPRSGRNSTPALMAKVNNNLECYKVIVDHRPPIPQVRLPEYYQGQITRQEAKKLLLNNNNDKTKSDGRFLLRKSSKIDSMFVLSLVENLCIYHYEIVKKKNMYFIDDGPYFKCLETMIDHYSRFCDGLPCRLSTPVPPESPLDENHFKVIYLHARTQRPRDENPILRPLHHHSDTGFEPLQDANGNPMREDTYTATENQPLLGDDEVLSPEEFLAVEKWLSPMNRGGARSKFASKDSSESLNSTSQNLQIVSDRHSTSPMLTPSSLQCRRNADLSMDSSLRLENQSRATDVTSTSPIFNDSTLRLEANFPDYISAYRSMKGNKTKEVFGSIESDSLRIGPMLGVGEFGSVLKGIWVSPSGDEIDVAIKTLHENDSVTKESFLREAQVMMDLNHPYIVKLLGVCQGPPIAMVQELALMGSVLNYLLDYPSQIQVDFHFKLWAAQVADGMHYLEKKHFVHRDLAARNLLLDSMHLVKISDFGLSRALNANADYYKATDGGKWPLKWYAPESIFYGQFTSASDVWSYGVTLWEMFTFGDQPYGDLTGHEVASQLEKGERLPRPLECPLKTFDLMLRCWDENPKQRPTFKELTTVFRGSPEYVNIKPYFKTT